jgi:peptide methionine sulfoxide reductase MsrB
LRELESHLGHLFKQKGKIKVHAQNQTKPQKKRNERPFMTRFLKKEEENCTSHCVWLICLRASDLFQIGIPLKLLASCCCCWHFFILKKKMKIKERS